MITSDILVIGSGIAGLSYAYKMAESCPDKNVLILTKADEEESNTKYAQGGIAVVLDHYYDSFDKHVEDTMKAGAYTSDRQVVSLVVKEGPERLKELIELGADFDKNDNGDFDLGKEGGHTVNRIVHHKDITGWEMEKTLLNKINSLPNITILSHFFVIDLITNHHVGNVEAGESINCYGCYALDKRNGKIVKILSKIALLATGGCGQVYANTTNPKIATADGIGLAYRAKARIKDMQYVQFHPTALYQPAMSPCFLISEAVRGYGAVLRNHKGEAFMGKYDERKELASRDIVAKAIDSEMKRLGENHVFLDCTHINVDDFLEHFPNIYNKCKELKIDIGKDMIPVVPAAHYQCGGIMVDQLGRTTIGNLYASGECTYTGLHGANRLASNSLLEALVYSHRASLDSCKCIEQITLNNTIPEWNASGTVEPEEMIVISHNRRELQSLMSDLVGIVRSDERLGLAAKRIDLIYKETKELYNRSKLSYQLCELRNLITVAYLIVSQSAIQKENRGVFFNIDRT